MGDLVAARSSFVDEVQVVAEVFERVTLNIREMFVGPVGEMPTTRIQGRGVSRAEYERLCVANEEQPQVEFVLNNEHVIMFGGVNDTAEPFNSSEFDVHRGPGYWAQYADQQPVIPMDRSWSARFESPNTDVLRHLFGASWDDRQGGGVRDLMNGIVWPDEGYPCQVCWSIYRWPWEPARACPLSVPVESTYCEAHTAGILAR